MASGNCDDTLTSAALDSETLSTDTPVTCINQNDADDYRKESRDFLEGSRIGEKLKMHAKDGKRFLNVTPILVDFRRLLQSQQLKRENKETVSIVPGIPDRELLHAVVGLYDVCLSEMTPDVIYSTVCDKRAKTILLIRDLKDVFLEFEQKRDGHNDKSSKEQKTDYQVKIGELDSSTTDDKFKAEEGPPATFAECFSDTESEEEEESDDDEEDFSAGINNFLSMVTQRRKTRLSHQGPYKVEHVGAENRIVAAATFDKKYIKSGEKVAHLTLIATRKRFRKLGIGKYIIQKLKDTAVVGPHDALVVHSDVSAVDFFSRYGFSDDIILNNRWREISEQFTNCTLMTHIPAYTGQAISGQVTEFDLLSLESELRKWKEKSIEAYQAQVTIIERMKSEMIRLRVMVSTQEGMMKDMSAKISRLESNKAKYDKEILLHRIRSATPKESGSPGDILHTGDAKDVAMSNYDIFSGGYLPDPDAPSSPLPSGPRTEQGAGLAMANLILKNTESELKRYMIGVKHSKEVYDHGKDIAEFHNICEGFKQSLRKDPKAYRECTVTSVSKALLNQNAVERYATKLQSVGESALVMKLYYCGSKEQPGRLKDILKNGFSDQDITLGDYGKGIYFSRYASTATYFSPANKVLIAEVIIGKCQTIVQKEQERRTPDTGHHSVLCPGRLTDSSGNGSINQEYIIFEPSQALPLDLIEFTASPSHQQ